MPVRLLKRFVCPQVDEHDLNDLGAAGQKFALDPITAGTHSLVAKHQQWQSAVLAYLACITYVDRQVGRLMQALDESPYGDNTWIVLWSDHGWHLGEKQHWGKWTPWRQSTRVPLIIVPPRNQFSPSRRNLRRSGEFSRSLSDTIRNSTASFSTSRPGTIPPAAAESS